MGICVRNDGGCAADVDAHGRESVSIWDSMNKPQLRLPIDDIETAAGRTTALAANPLSRKQAPHRGVCCVWLSTKWTRTAPRYATSSPDQARFQQRLPAGET